MKWIKFGRAQCELGHDEWKDAPVGRLMKTVDGRVLLVGEIDTESGNIGSCSCCAEMGHFTEYCDDLIWLIDAAKKTGETALPAPAPAPVAEAPVWEASNDGETWVDLAPQLQGDVIINNPFKFRRRKT